MCEGEELIVMGFSAVKVAAASNPSGPGFSIALIHPEGVLRMLNPKKFIGRVVKVTLSF